MPENNVGRVSGSVPSFVSIEPDASMPDPAKELMCVDRASEGAEGASGAGTEALVRRFSNASGAGGGGGFVDLPAKEGTSCADEALRAIGACGATAVLATGTAGAALLLSGIGCVGNLGSLVECLANEKASAEP